MTDIDREEFLLQGWVLLAFESASQRLTVEREIGPAAYAAVGEALFWACVADEGYESLIGARYRDAPSADYNGRLLGGIKWVRNRSTHQRAIVLDQHFGAELDAMRLDLAQLDSRTHLKWRPSDDIPPGRHDAGREVYDKRLSGHPVSEAVEACRSWYYGLVLNEVTNAAGMSTGNLPGLPPPNGRP